MQHAFRLSSVPEQPTASHNSRNIFVVWVSESSKWHNRRSRDGQLHLSLRTHISGGNCSTTDNGRRRAASRFASTFAIGSTAENLTLVVEILSRYQTVTSIHIYALSPNTTDDDWLQHEFMHIESKDITDQKATISDLGKLGIVTNPDVRVRNRKSQPSFTPSHNTKPARPAQPAGQHNGSDKQQTPKVVPQSKPQVAFSEKQPTTASKGIKTGSIFQSFAKAATKPAAQKMKPEAQANCTSMALSDDGEADDSDILHTESQAHKDASIKSRREREEELRRMMEEDDDVKAESDESAESVMDHEMEDNQEEQEPQLIASEKPEIEAPEVISSSTGDGRRRGKRRVMKKKRILDDQGYMGMFVSAVVAQIDDPTVTNLNSHDSRTRLGIILGR